MIREKLPVLTHRLQILIRSKPKEMGRLLELYRNFLSAKEALERYFNRKKALDLAGRGDTGSLVPGKTRVQGKSRKEALAGVLALFRSLQLQERDLNDCSRVLDAFFRELENIVCLLEVCRHGTAPALLPVPAPPAGTLVRRQVPLLPATSRAHTRSRATA